jgi:hypothetical protein
MGLRGELGGGELGADDGRARVAAPMRSRAPWLIRPLIACPAILARVISPNMLAELPAKTSGAALKLVAGNANAASLISGAAVAQPGGTDKAPTVAA